MYVCVVYIFDSRVVCSIQFINLTCAGVPFYYLKYMHADIYTMCSVVHHLVYEMAHN